MSRFCEEFVFGLPSVPATPNAASQLCDITPDSRYAAFISKATDIIPEVIASDGDMYLRDMASNRVRIRQRCHVPSSCD